MISSLGWENLKDRRKTYCSRLLAKLSTLMQQLILGQRFKGQWRGNNRQFNIPQISSSVYQHSFVTVYGLLQHVIDSPSYKIFSENYLTMVTMTAEIIFIFLIFFYTPSDLLAKFPSGSFRRKPAKYQVPSTVAIEIK